MININELIDNKCIDFFKLLILKGKSIGLSDEEIHILSIMMILSEAGVRVITPLMIRNYSSQSDEVIDAIMLKMINQHYLDRRGGSLDFRPLYRLLLKQPKEEKKEINLVAAFEDGFGRSLNGMEVEFINEFKRAGYDDEMILEALKESLKSNVRNFRYIERILENWREYGMKKRHVPEKTVSDEISDEIKHYEWWKHE